MDGYHIKEIATEFLAYYQQGKKRTRLGQFTIEDLSVTFTPLASAEYTPSVLNAISSYAIDLQKKAVKEHEDRNRFAPSGEKE